MRTIVFRFPVPRTPVQTGLRRPLLPHLALPIAAFWILACGPDPASPPAVGIPSETIRDAVDDPGVRLIYVPAYTYALDQGNRVGLTATLMIHNVSPRKITIDSVRYYDAGGVLVRTLLDTPRELGPLETLEFRQEPETTNGGAGANFLVGWTGPNGPAPLVEALMAGHQGTGRLTFTSRGVEVGEIRPERP